MLRRSFIVSLTLLTVLLGRSAYSWACAVCLGGSSDAATDGYNASVLFLMSTPYLVMGSIVGALILAYRRARKRSALADREAIAQLTWTQEDSGR
jgi:hypothetical protein